MRVTKRNARESAPNALRPSDSPRLLQITLLLLTFTLGFVVAQQGWYRPLFDLVGGLARHPNFTISSLLHRSDEVVMVLDLGFADYQRLLDQREQALRLGVNAGGEGDAVAATMGASSGSVDVMIRLPEGPAEGLEGASWPLEVVVDGDEMLLDLRRFSLTPADETFLSTWGYVESLRRADVLAPRVELVRLVLNGTDWGLYILEEVPTADWLADQGREDSVVVAFDTGAYWDAVARLSDAVPGSGFQYATITGCPFDDEDTTSVAVCASAVDLLRRLRDGEIPPAAVFDVERMATLVAQNALWRGTMALDWRALRFAYDPSTGRLEPIATTTVYPAMASLPDTVLAAPALQVRTAQILARLVRPEAISRLQDALSADLDSLQRALGAELGYVPLPWQTLEIHRAVIQRQLAPDPPLLATVEADGGALVLRINNPQPFPVEIIGIDVGESAFLAADPAWVHERDRQAMLDDEQGGVVLRAALSSRTIVIRLRVPPDAVLTAIDSVPEEVRLTTRILGLEGHQVVVATWQSGGRTP